jgi:hypothetical protein
MTATKPTHCYVSRRPCGCIVALAAYHYNWRESVGRLVARDINRGLIVECITWAEYHKRGRDLATVKCTHGEPVSADMTQGSFLTVMDDD